VDQNLSKFNHQNNKHNNNLSLQSISLLNNNKKTYNAKLNRSVLISTCESTND